MAGLRSRSRNVFSAVGRSVEAGDEIQRIVTGMNPVNIVLRLAGKHKQFNMCVAGIFLLAVWIFILLVTLQADGKIEGAKYVCDEYFNGSDTGFKPDKGHERECKAWIINADAVDHIRILICIPVFVLTIFFAIPVIQFWVGMLSHGATLVREKLLNEKVNIDTNIHTPGTGHAIMHAFAVMFGCLVPLLPALQWDGVLDWEWTWAFIPFFVLFGAMIFRAFHIVYHGETYFLKSRSHEASGSSEEYPMQPVGARLGVPMLVTATIRGKRL